jgi:hypothetical protein
VVDPCGQDIEHHGSGRRLRIAELARDRGTEGFKDGCAHPASLIHLNLA